MKTFIICIISALSIISIIHLGYKYLPAQQDNKLVANTTDYKKTWYYDGEILYPDNTHSDTLVVIRATFLNKIMHSDKSLVVSKNDLDLGPDDNDDEDDKPELVTIKTKDDFDNEMFNNSSNVSIPALLTRCCASITGKKLLMPQEYNDNNHTDDLTTTVTDESILIEFQ